MNRTQKIFAVFFFASIILWIAFVVLIVEFALLAFANALIPSILYTLIGAIFVVSTLSTYAAVSIREHALASKPHSSYVPETSGLNQWACKYCQTVNNEESVKCQNCGAPKKVV
jgi:formate dehydrogenase maturation protein FdhE